MEANTYEIQWRKEGEQFIGALSEPHQITLNASSLEELEEGFQEILIEKFGDGEAVIQWFPPMGNEKEDTLSIYYSLGWNESVCPVGPTEKYYLNTCMDCGFVLGRKIEIPLLIEDKLSDDIIAIEATRYGWSGILISEAFSELLELPKKWLQPVQFTSKRRKAFFELIVPRTIPFVSFSDIKLQGWRCPKCLYQTFSFNDDKIAFNIRRAICDQDIPNTKVFLAGLENEKPSLIVTADHWNSLKGKKGKKGASVDKVMVVDKDIVVYNPKLPTYKEVWGDANQK